MSNGNELPKVLSSDSHLIICTITLQNHINCYKKVLCFFFLQWKKMYFITYPIITQSDSPRMFLSKLHPPQNIVFACMSSEFNFYQIKYHHVNYFRSNFLQFDLYSFFCKNLRKGVMRFSRRQPL